MLGDVLKAADANLDDSLKRLLALLSIDSISTDPLHADACRQAADWLVNELRDIGFAASARSTPGHPIVVAHQGPDGGPRVLFYAHYDVQPVDPLSEWHTPPFSPRVIEGSDGRRRIFARGASDDKGQLLTFVEACRAWKQVTGHLPIGVTLVLEGEEESGSTNLEPFLAANANELAADVALICDTNMWDRQRGAITCSLRGLIGEEVTITAASRDLHSGMYGAAARNPIHVLADILAGLHDANGRVTLPGFYDGVPELAADQKRQWETLGFDAKGFLGDIGLAIPAGERGRSVLEQVWSRPTCEVNGVVGGYTGQGFKTVIPAEAKAKVSFRLVGDQDPDQIVASFRAYVQGRLPADCKVAFHGHARSPAVRLPVDSPWISKTRQALADEWNADPALVGSGGSIPVAGSFKRLLGLDSVMVGFALDDDRIHSPNEKYDLASFRGGIRSWSRILAAFAE